MIKYLKNNKKNIALLCISLGLIFSMPNIDNNTNISNIVYAAEATNNNNPKEENTVEATTNNYKLINDSSKKLDTEDINKTSIELDSIFKESKPETGGQFKIYTFIYNDSAKSPVDAEKEILSKNKLDSTIKPIIFIINTKNNKYRYIIDERIEPFISKNYLDSMAKTILIKNDSITEKSLNKFLIRIATINNISINRNIKISKDVSSNIDKNNFDIHNFDNDANNPDSNKGNSNTTTLDKNKKDDSSKYTIISLLLAFATIIVVFFIRKKKFSKK